jgi:hypothetical protein
VASNTPSISFTLMNGIAGLLPSHRLSTRNPKA